MLERLKNSMKFEKLIPEVGAAEISYTKLLEMLSRKQLKRLWVLGEGRAVVAERIQGPVANEAANHQAVLADQRDLLSHYIIDERPENELMEQKLRFFCELPGDAWDDNILASLIKKTYPARDHNGNTAIVALPKRVIFDKFGNPAINTGRVKTFLFDQSSCEVVVVEPQNASVFLADNKEIFFAVLCLSALRSLLQAIDHLVSRLGLKPKDQFTVQVDKLTSPSAKEFNITSSVKKNKAHSKLDTGVRFADVAGIDHIINDIINVLSMMKGESKWKEMGVKMPRGILLSGAPGTGKTLLAKAIAGEARVPFYSANGAQFIEKYHGVCAARIRKLFAQAEKQGTSGAIIFIDEIDALGLARGAGSGDVGSTEREQGLLQLLVEMDGFKSGKQILVLGATNRIKVLDRALLRPG
jgi:cell division protease FtsH